MMSGGDLDGDVYMAIWDKEIVDAVNLKIEENMVKGIEPAFPSPASPDDDLQKEIHTEVLGEHNGSDKFSTSESICKYFENDRLGKMSNMHLKLAIEKGLDNHWVETASFLCSIQVDFAKHGRCIKT